MSLCLTPLQETWLTELGVDAQWLARFRAAPREAAPSRQIADADSGPGASRGTGTGTSTSTSTSTARGPRSGPVPVAALLEREVLARVASAQEAEPLPAAHAAPTGREPAAVSLAPDLAALHARILVCEACPLHAGRSHAVPGTGDLVRPDYLIVGEMPGVDDDLSGLPFQGAAGDLLQAMLASAGLSHNTLFMTSVIKCRPSGGRAAQAAEVAACLPYLHQQIELLRPRHILALGRLAARAVLDTRESLAALRGRPHAYRTEAGSSIPVWVTHHPASLLLRPAHKAEAWRDLLGLAGADAGSGI
jgi:DNA polymerase